MTSADTDIRLTEWTSCGGCAAKWGASPLSALVRDLSSSADPALLVGLAPFDDAAVYKLSDDLALVSTTDFFPPLVDDPADFGAIAAANACSDVFAMGGRVVLALNISAFPERMPPEAIAAILHAAADLVHADDDVMPDRPQLALDQQRRRLRLQRFAQLWDRRVHERRTPAPPLSTSPTIANPSSRSTTAGSTQARRPPDVWGS